MNLILKFKIIFSVFSTNWLIFYGIKFLYFCLMDLKNQNNVEKMDRPRLKSRRIYKKFHLAYSLKAIKLIKWKRFFNIFLSIGLKSCKVFSSAATVTTTTVMPKPFPCCCTFFCSLLRCRQAMVQKTEKLIHIEIMKDSNDNRLYSTN